MEAKHKHKKGVMIGYKNNQLATIDSREVAEMLGKEHSELLKEIEGRKDNKNVGIIPTLEKGNFHLSNYFIPSTYRSGTREYKCYLVTKMGCELLGNKQQGEKGILFTAKYVERFNEMEQAIKGQALNTSELSPELQMFNQMFQAMANTELEIKKVKAVAEETNEKLEETKEELEEAKEEIKGIREAVTLEPNQWRKDTATLINKIANKLGGFEHIKPIRDEAYSLLNNTYGVDINRRLLNKRKNMALEGCSKSKINKVNYLDVIAEDKKLINGYINIVGRLAVKYGIKELNN